MPSINHLTCHIEASPTNTPLKEHGVHYQDSFVGTYIAAVGPEQKFSIHLTSDAYISPGLAMYVFIDGVYQCNRFRTGLEPHHMGAAPSTSSVDFRVRQKEERLPFTNEIMGREWRMTELDIIPDTKKLPDGTSLQTLRHTGLIEVVVLRLHGETEPMPSGNPLDASLTDLEFPPRPTIAGATRPRARVSPAAVAHADPALAEAKAPHRSRALDAGEERARSPAKPYWTMLPSWRASGYLAPAEPQTAMPASLAGDKTHSITGGRGRHYSHAIGTPAYMDSMSHPFAVFGFRYRSEEAIIEHVYKGDGRGFQRDQVARRERYMGLGLEALVEKLMLREGTEATGRNGMGGEAHVLGDAAQTEGYDVRGWIKSVYNHENAVPAANDSDTDSATVGAPESESATLSTFSTASSSPGHIYIYEPRKRTSQARYALSWEDESDDW